MIINKLEIENFKCFGEKTEIPFATLTLIFGENGAGKSTILQTINYSVFPMAKYAHCFKDDKAFRSSILPVITRDMIYGGDDNNVISFLLDYMCGDEKGAISLDYVKEEMEVPVMESGKLDLNALVKQCNQPVRFFTEYDFEKIHTVGVWLDEFNESIYSVLAANRENITNSYSVFIDCRIALEYLDDNEEIQKHLNKMLKANADCCAKFYSLNDGLCIIPGWGAYVKTGDYKKKKEQYQERYAQDIGFFGGNFSQEELILRYRPEVLKIINHSYDFYEPDIFNDPLCINDHRLERDLFFSNDEVGIRFLSLASRGYTPWVGIKANWDLGTVGLGNALQAHIKLSPLGYVISGIALSIQDRLTEAVFDLAVKHVPPLREVPAAEYGESHPYFSIANDSQLKRKLDKWMTTLKTGYNLDFKVSKDFNTTDCRNPKDKVSLLLTAAKGRDPMQISISQTGFGFSQMLPILLELASGHEKCIMIEQPELHIHPRLQAELGSVFVDAIRENGHQIIAETHSEHLMLRILRLIREESRKDNPLIKSSDVAVIYVQPTDTGSDVYKMDISEDGRILSPCPGGFFPERMKEMFGEM